MEPKEIRSIRSKWNLTQEQLAAALGYSDRARVSDLETGKSKTTKTIELLLGYINDYGPRLQSRN